MSDRQPDAAQAEAKRREDEARARAEASQQVARQYEATTKARAELNAEAERVMAESRPVLSQEENDKAKLGIRDPEATTTEEAPEMPPLAEQQQRIAEAEGAKPAYQTRQATPGQPAQRPAPPPPERREPARPQGDDKR